MKKTFFITQFVLIVLAPLLAVAIDTAPPESFASSHSDVVTWIFGLVLGGFIFLLWRLIDKNDAEHKNILTTMKEESEKKWEAIGSLSETLHHLKGEHDVLKSVHTHRRATDD